MKVAVLGGKLQGVEVLYLAQKAGFETLLIDKNMGVPAQNLCDNFLQYTFEPGNNSPNICGKMPDFILPACENMQALEAAKTWADRHKIPFALDLNAYRTTQSKKLSNQLFVDLGLPMPKPYPQCGYPIVIKPDNASGSEGVKIIWTHDEMERQKLTEGTAQVIQEYLEGPSYSIEVIGHPGNYRPLQVTELTMDGTYDCCQVIAGPIQPTIIAKLEEMVIQIAEKIYLHGIMDLEVILHKNELKILEIDARFPSQTPIAVYHSTGINMVEILAELFVKKRVARHRNQSPKYCLLEHLHIQQNKLAVCGEHIMTGLGPLQHRNNFWGADEALTGHNQKSNSWVGTFIFSSQTREELALKKQLCHNKLRDTFIKTGAAS